MVHAAATAASQTGRHSSPAVPAAPPAAQAAPEAAASRTPWPRCQVPADRQTLMMRTPRLGWSAVHPATVVRPKPPQRRQTPSSTSRQRPLQSSPPLLKPTPPCDAAQKTDGAAKSAGWVSSARTAPPQPAASPRPPGQAPHASAKPHHLRHWQPAYMLCSKMDSSQPAPDLLGTMMISITPCRMDETMRARCDVDCTQHSRIGTCQCLYVTGCAWHFDSAACAPLGNRRAAVSLPCHHIFVALS